MPPEIVEAFCGASSDGLKNQGLSPIAYDWKPLERRKLALPQTGANRVALLADVERPPKTINPRLASVILLKLSRRSELVSQRDLEWNWLNRVTFPLSGSWEVTKCFATLLSPWELSPR